MEKIKVAVHSGDFHADDVFATAVLSLWLKKDLSELDIMRTRDSEVYSKADYVLDTGFIYNKELGRFDHHIGDIGKRENGIPYATFGLLWKEYGEEICQSKEIAKKLEKKLVLPIDATDNGITISKPVFSDFRDVFLFDVIQSFKPAWKVAGISLEESFLKSVVFAREMILREIEIYRGLEDAEIFFKKEYDKNEDKKIIILEAECPWESFIDEYKEVMFIITPSSLGWKAKSPQINGTFDNRKNFPKSWSGLVDGELAKVSGVEDALFCHKACFVAIAKSKDGAIALAKKALEA
jgi:uncharacterized UPF0160 family protein